MQSRLHEFLALLLLGCLSASSGCLTQSDSEVAIYSALDREFSEPILKDFERETGITVRDSYDIESSKTVGLVSRIIQERNRPACDVFWNNEILHTLRLEKLGLLHAYQSPRAEEYPPNYRSPAGYWHGFASRARILIVNTEVVKGDQWPDSIEDIVDPNWKGQVGVAKPLFGTTATHAAVLFSTWGEARARDFFQQVKENTKVMSGNKQVATAVGRGQLAFGLTDTDDAIIERDQGYPVEIIFPDQQEEGLGTLFIPNTLCVIKDGPNTENARKLVDYLLDPRIESRLAQGASAQFPVHRQADANSRAMPDEPIKWMDVDFAAAADQWETAASFLRDLFASAE